MQFSFIFYSTNNWCRDGAWSPGSVSLIRLWLTDNELITSIHFLLLLKNIISIWLYLFEIPSEFIFSVQIMEYCKHHSATPEAPVPEHKKYRTDNIIEWDKNFMQVDMEMLFNIALVRIETASVLDYHLFIQKNKQKKTITNKQQAANYLEIRGLLDLSGKTIANHMKGFFILLSLTALFSPPLTEGLQTKLLTKSVQPSQFQRRNRSQCVVALNICKKLS